MQQAQQTESQPNRHPRATRVAHRALPLAALAAQLRDAPGRLDAFDGGDPATDLRTAFSWSYRTLSDRAAALFRLLGGELLGGDCAAEVSPGLAAHLAGVTVREAGLALAELAHAYLVSERAPNRYTIHELLRAYAAEQAHAVGPGPPHRGTLCRVQPSASPSRPVLTW